jgi:hypothetical protein
MENTKKDIELFTSLDGYLYNSGEEQQHLYLFLALYHEKFNALTYDEKLNIFNEYRKWEDGRFKSSFQGMDKIKEDALSDAMGMLGIEDCKYFHYLEYDFYITT